MKVIGIDIGGTRIKGGIFEDHKLLRKTSVATNAIGRDQIIASLENCIDSLMEKDVGRIGVISAGDCDPVNGVVLRALNLKGWNNVPVKAILEEHYHIPVDFDNDAIGALIGEASLYPDLHDVTLLTFGTGVGGASLIDGKVSRNPDHAWGHYCLIPNGLDCPCGKKGCAERYLSATAVQEQATAAFQRRMNTIELFRLYKHGNPKAKAVLTLFGERLDLFLSDIEREIAPQLILLGGGLMTDEGVVSSLLKFDPSKYAFAKLKNDAGITGAALLGEKK